MHQPSSRSATKATLSIEQLRINPSRWREFRNLSWSDQCFCAQATARSTLRSNPTVGRPATDITTSVIPARHIAVTPMELESPGRPTRPVGPVHGSTFISVSRRSAHPDSEIPSRRLGCVPGEELSRVRVMARWTSALHAGSIRLRRRQSFRSLTQKNCMVGWPICNILNSGWAGDLPVK